MSRTTHRASRAATTLGAVAALTLVLAACGGGDDAATPAASETGSAAASSATATEPSAEASQDASAAAGEAASPTEGTTDASAEATDTASQAPAAAGDIASCVIGDWSLDPASAKEQMEAVLGGVEVEMTVEGHSYATLDGETMTSDVDTTSTFAAGDATGSSETVGKITYAYTIEGDQLTMTEVISAEGTATTTSGGQSQTVDFADVAAASLGMAQTVTCDAQVLTLTTSAGDISSTQRFDRR